MDTGGIVKVTSFDESNKSINNAFDKAIADHADKMKRVQEQNKQDEESKSVGLYFTIYILNFTLQFVLHLPFTGHFVLSLQLQSAVCWFVVSLKIFLLWFAIILSTLLVFL